MAVTIGVAAWAGYKADQYFEFRLPVFLLSLSFAAFGGIMYRLYRSITRDE